MTATEKSTGVESLILMEIFGGNGGFSVARYRQQNMDVTTDDDGWSSHIPSVLIYVGDILDSSRR